MMNFSGFIDTGSQFNGGMSDSSITHFYLNNKSEIEKRLDGLDEDTRQEVQKHLDEFSTVEQMEMFIKQKTSGGDQII
ncbi:hypothetical protein [Herbinix luporum]|jgi:hypothetical protein|uniref:Uncharacterized protein n=1 Tax=Herbinix luporum TaxID=1679721 RepID=A0A0K8J3I2_9FIRM|nr:hypothetical protein [Herbinix luporum]MDI9489069.1 hypothetical protein [Bacillota bacterium]CUH92166.1 hypothetical protein SD1D_0615 [Herbinix luporum]HHT56984.1 hypothetical protein [Herbinix luporum]